MHSYLNTQIVLEMQDKLWMLSHNSGHVRQFNCPHVLYHLAHKFSSAAVKNLDENRVCFIH